VRCLVTEGTEPYRLAHVKHEGEPAPSDRKQCLIDGGWGCLNGRAACRANATSGGLSYSLL